MTIPGIKRPRFSCVVIGWTRQFDYSDRRNENENQEDQSSEKSPHGRFGVVQWLLNARSSVTSGDICSRDQNELKFSIITRVVCEQNERRML